MQRPGAVKIICPRERTSRADWQLIYGRRASGTSVSGLSFRRQTPLQSLAWRSKLHRAMNQPFRCSSVAVRFETALSRYVVRSSMDLQMLLIHHRATGAAMILEFLAINETRSRRFDSAKLILFSFRTAFTFVIRVIASGRNHCSVSQSLHCSFNICLSPRWRMIFIAIGCE